LGHKYSLILSREITQEESEILRESGCYGATFVTDSLPTDLDVKVTKVDVDDAVSESLEKAIESGLEAAKKVPELSVPGLQVPALPVEKKADQPGVVAGEVIEVTDVVPSVENEEELVEASVSPAVNGKAAPKPAANGKTSTKSATNGRSVTKRTTNQKAAARKSSADDAKELSEAVTLTD
jgi:hypothetical protein